MMYLSPIFIVHSLQDGQLSSHCHQDLFCLSHILLTLLSYFVHWCNHLFHWEKFCSLSARQFIRYWVFHSRCTGNYRAVCHQDLFCLSHILLTLLSLFVHWRNHLFHWEKFCSLSARQFKRYWVFHSRCTGNYRAVRSHGTGSLVSPHITLFKMLHLAWLGLFLLILPPFFCWSILSSSWGGTSVKNNLLSNISASLSPFALNIQI
jgi:hypothetical protein